MASGDTPLVVSQYAQKQIKKYSEGVLLNLRWNFDFRSRLLEQDRIYAREVDQSEHARRGEAQNKAGDATKFRNVVVPVVGPQVDSTKAFFVEMFLNSYPIFPVVSDPQYADAATQLETILGKSAIYYQWGKHFAMCFQDGLKHNIQAMEVEWWRSKVTSVVTDAQRSKTQGVPREIIYEGNRLVRRDLYNLIFDPRVPPSEVHTRGEFVGYSELITRMELKQLFLDLDSSLTMNATDAFQSGTATYSNDLNAPGSFYVPPVNLSMFRDARLTQQNWMQWANLSTQNKIRYSDMYEKTVLYCRIIPKEFGLFGKTDTRAPGDPQIFKFILINQKVPIFVQRMTNAHNMLPIVIGQMNEDGLGVQTKSYADNAAPYQALATSLYNSGLHSQRRKVYDRLLYDPSRVNKADIDKVDPVGRIPVKSEGYGKPVSEAVYQIPYRDEGVAQILGMAREVVDMADKSTGSNRIQQGQFQKGNKTRFEVENVLGNSDARPKTSAILLEIAWLGPIKEMLKTNILQYQPPTTLFNAQLKKEVSIDPTRIRDISWEFQLADGILPSDKLLSFDLFGSVLQYASANPAGAAEWDLTGMFAYQLKMRGARWVDDFKRTPEQQQAYIQQSRLAQTPIQTPQLPAAGAPSA